MGATVLVVDDSATIRRMVGRILTGAGYDVTEAADGVEALAQLANHPATRLVLCDVHMPRMNGLEFLEEMRVQRKLTIPVLMVTTEGQSDTIQRARALGAAGWIVKPLKATNLLDAAKRLTSGDAPPIRRRRVRSSTATTLARTRRILPR